MGFGDDNHRVQSVVELLKKQSPLSPKQERFCNNACVERFLKAKGDSVKKAAKHLRNCLSWRDSFAVDHLMADEFSPELAEGMAYVAGHDDELRPVMIFRIRQDYQKFHSQKLFIRLLVFTLEVAVQTMGKNVEQFVLLFDASLFKSAAAFTNMLVASLKIIADNYPRRLHKAFVIDPPSLFSYLWKGVRSFVEVSSVTMTISSVELEESFRLDDLKAYPKMGSCSSSRFSFTVSHHLDSVKPWYLSLKDASGGPRMNGRSLSFASPIARNIIRRPPTPKPSFLQSPSLFFRRDDSRVERSSESFVPFLKFYRMSYDEMIYRSKMRPPLGGLVSIVSPQIRRTHMSVSQRF
ncbi:uncharacterized protein LOC131001062 [Salvia miltiorrhiza]|uniref:uncharacterized protein LOC131001062 n=1 Tax=Salvia miltiorrhiza TaxID=226208 RepID=UPI0025ACBA43|nr:uncharacterized protein LOC131001062 [Salvia miltiorrhiza]